MRYRMGRSNIPKAIQERVIDSFGEGREIISDTTGKQGRKVVFKENEKKKQK
jgi:hypothetical protein